MNKTKITAGIIAIAMSGTMVAGTVTSVSAASYDTPIQEEDLNATVSTTGKTVVWNYTGDGTKTLNYFVGKYSDPRNESMAAKAITNASLTRSGSNYILTLDTQAVTRDYKFVSYTASIRTVTATLYDGTTVSGVQNGDTFTITFDTSKELPWVGSTYSKGYENSIELNFTTTLDDIGGIWSILPSTMKNPNCYLLFTD